MGATPIQINAANCQHLLIRTHYDTYHAVDKALRKLILEALPNIYIDAIKHDTLGCGQATALIIMDHIWDTYGVIDDDQLAGNLETIKSLWQLPAPHR